MDTILSFFSGDLLSMKTLVIMLVGMFIGWNIPQPAWAKALWVKITKKAPAVQVAADAAVSAEQTVAETVSSVVDAATTTTPAAPAAPAQGQ